MNISKELLSEVLEGDYKFYTFDGNSIWYSNRDYGAFTTRCFNIYELAHKCKEWAYQEFNVTIASFKDMDGIWVAESEIDGSDKYDYDNIFEADTEPEAIFKACEWILEQNENS